MSAGVGRTSDVGLPRVRTALAWQRTGVAAAGLCAGGAVAWARLGQPVLAVAAVAVALLPLVVLGRHRLGPDSVWQRLVAVVGAAAVLAVLGVAAAVAGLL